MTTSAEDFAGAPPPPPRSIGNTRQLIDSREQTHGAWADTAYATHRLVRVLGELIDRRLSRGQPDLEIAQAQALSMIFAKIARIVSGDPNHPDHWDDIAGYARLARGD
jgi:hypothetical protein